MATPNQEVDERGNTPRQGLLRANGQLPARVTADGKIFIGDEQILADRPIASDSIKTELIRHGRFNLLTISLIVGEIAIETRSPDTRGRMPNELETDG